MQVLNIGVFGRTNTGKSSLVNALTGQEISIVSDQAGTTTDPVGKRMEIPEIGPCRLVDTAGLDDVTDLGAQRVNKSRAWLNRVDLALILFNSNSFTKLEQDLAIQLRGLKVPFVLVHTQSDIVPLDEALAQELSEKYGTDVLEFSVALLDEQEQQENIELLLAFIIKALSSSPLRERPMFEGLVEEKQTVVLVCPIDVSAPTGRLILPQVMAIRDLLDRRSTAVVLQVEELADYLATHPTPDLVVTDSQAFAPVSACVPPEVPLTSFSVLLARSKGPFAEYVAGAASIDALQDGDKILILESCTHHASCEDIGRVKLPRLFQKYTGKQLQFTVVAGLDPLPENLRDYRLVVQCGGCMINKRELLSRVNPAMEAGIPICNYGMAIAYMNGIFQRSIAPFCR
ncbi:MAG: [FeFe] hydrogenase H-cluster maturation GTPase HydF [Bacteroidales bacterium]|nr:[FeFe] hydrogenase H-cluster maturation GTPase HydF [Bacteroidales bacterium]